MRKLYAEERPVALWPPTVECILCAGRKGNADAAPYNQKRLNSAHGPRRPLRNAINRAEKTLCRQTLCRSVRRIQRSGESISRRPDTRRCNLHRALAAANGGAPLMRRRRLAASRNRWGPEAEALYSLAVAYARARQWPQAQTTVNELRRAFPESSWTRKAFAQVGQIAEDAKNPAQALSFYRAAVNAYPATAEVATPQFKLAWAAQDAKNFAESRDCGPASRRYADKTPTSRAAGYWPRMPSAPETRRARALYRPCWALYAKCMAISAAAAGA